MNLNELNPGIRKTVAWLRDNGFETVDSGDGKTHDFSCDLEIPYVHMVVNPADLVSETDRLAELVKGTGQKLMTINDFQMAPDNEEVPSIQATYDPVDQIATISLFYFMLKE